MRFLLNAFHRSPQHITSFWPRTALLALYTCYVYSKRCRFYPSLKGMTYIVINVAHINIWDSFESCYMAGTMKEFVYQSQCDMFACIIHYSGMAHYIALCYPIVLMKHQWFMVPSASNNPMSAYLWYHSVVSNNTICMQTNQLIGNQNTPFHLISWVNWGQLATFKHTFYQTMPKWTLVIYNQLNAHNPHSNVNSQATLNLRYYYLAWSVK